MFNFNRALILAGMRLGIPGTLDLIRPPMPMPERAPPDRVLYGVRYGGAEGSRDRLYLDRSSSVRKMQRWLNDGDILPSPPPDEHALLRHAWYRRQKEREARAAAKEAWDNA